MSQIVIILLYQNYTKLQPKMPPQDIIKLTEHAQDPLLIVADNAISEMLKKYHEINNQIKTLTEDKTIIAKKIESIMTNYNSVVDKNNQKLVSKQTINRTSFNSSLFKKDNPELYDKYRQISTYSKFNHYK